MSETLPRLLLRLSEAGDGAYITGRDAKPFFGKAFERLLALRVLVEKVPLDRWLACRACECDLGERPIQTVGDRLVAACPVDAGRDLVLEVGDNRVFEIDPGNLIAEIAPLSGQKGGPEQLNPGVWKLPTAAGEDLLLVARLTAACDPMLIPALCFKLGRHRGVILLPAETPIGQRHQLRQAGFRDFTTVDVLRPNGSIDQAMLTRDDKVEVRLVVALGAKRAVLDGIELQLTGQLFRTLLALASAAGRGDGYLEATILEKEVWRDQLMPAARQTRDVIDHLRKRLPDRRLVETLRHPSRYRLGLSAAEVSLRP